jgi:hypothetical protein
MRVDEMLAAGGSGRHDAVGLRLRVTAVDTGFRLTASLSGEEGPLGRRVVNGVACEDLASAAVLIAALAIDPDVVPPDPNAGADVPPPPLVEQRSEPEPEVGSADPARSDDVVAFLPATDDARSRERPRELVGVVQLGVGVGIGRLAAPLPMALGRLGGGIEHRAFRGLVRVSGFGPSDGDVPGSSGGGTFGAVTGGVAGCGRTRGSPWSFVGCLATDVGSAHGRGRRIQNTRSNRSVWWGVEAEATVEYAFNRRWSLSGSVEAGVTPLRTRFVVDGQGHACCVRWGAGLRAGVLARFGPATDSQ